MSYHRFGRIHLRSADVYAFGHRIIRADFKEVVLTEQDLRELFEAYNSISNRGAYVLLADGRTPAIFPDELAELRTQLETESGRIAVAMITNSYWHNMLQNISLSVVMKTQIPCRYFSDADQALHWAKQQVEEYDRKQED